MAKNFVKIPEHGSIDYKSLYEMFGVNGDDYCPEEMMTCENISKAIEIIIDEILNQLNVERLLKKKFKKTNYKNGGVVWEISRYECYFAIYLKHGSLSYTYRLNTNNRTDRGSVLYFDFEHMPFYVETLLYKILQDFTELISECINLSYTYEGSYADIIPRGTHCNGSWFCSIHEDKISKPRHYYDGYIDYDNDRQFVYYDFDKWLEENKKH